MVLAHALFFLSSSAKKKGVVCYSRLQLLFRYVAVSVAMSASVCMLLFAIASPTIRLCFEAVQEE